MKGAFTGPLKSDTGSFSRYASPDHTALDIGEGKELDEQAKSVQSTKPSRSFGSVVRQASSSSSKIFQSGGMSPSSRGSVRQPEDGGEGFDKGTDVKISLGYYKFPMVHEPGRPKPKPKSFVFIPAKAMKQENFSFETTFEALGLTEPPSIIFRLNSANDTPTWNMRLPESRMELAAFQYELDNPEQYDEETTKRVHHPAKNEEDVSSPSHSEAGDVIAPPPIGRRDSIRNFQAHADSQVEIGLKGKHDEHDDIKWREVLVRRQKENKSRLADHTRESYRAALCHYQGVLREKCKRLLKGTYAACEQAGAMFRIDSMWSENYRHDAVTSWLTNNYSNEQTKLLGIGDISYYHKAIQEGLNPITNLNSAAKPYDPYDPQRQTSRPAKDIADEIDNLAFELPREVVYGFELAEHICVQLKEIKSDPGINFVEGMWEIESVKSGDPFEDDNLLREKALIESLRVDITCYISYMTTAPEGGNDGIDMLHSVLEFKKSNPNIADWNDEQKQQRFEEIYGYFYALIKGGHPEVDHELEQDRFDFLDEFYKPSQRRPLPLRTKMGPIAHQPGRKRGSFPHRGITHLIVTDDILLLEQMLVDVVPWGAILINGETASADMAVDCIQHGRPLISVKYTGGTADLVVGMLEKRKFFLMARKLDPDHPMEDVAYSIKMPTDRGLPTENDWLKEFDSVQCSTAVKMNVLLENWPDRFSEASIFVVDTFQTTEDDVQDRITQTMGVVFESAHELGGSVSEQKRLTYAWRVRHKFLYNANIFKLISDVLMMLITLLTLSSTVSAVLYSYFLINPNVLSASAYTIAQRYLLIFNLVLPLAATIVRGIYASVSPMLKYVALKNACVQVESEIYMYRTKVGKYGLYGRKKKAEDKNKDGKKDDKKGGGGKDDKDGKASNQKMGGNNPRRAFSNALDSIWAELSTSDVQNGSLRTPIVLSADGGPLEDINRRIRANREEQDNYLTVLVTKASKNKDNDKKKKSPDMSAEDLLLEEKMIQFKKSMATRKRSADSHHKKIAEDEKKEDERKRERELESQANEALEVTGKDKAENPKEEEEDWEFCIKCIKSFSREELLKKKPGKSCWGKMVYYLFTVWLKYAVAVYDRLYNEYKDKKIMLEQAARAAMDITASKKIITDDGLSALSADQYVRIRLLPMAANYSQKSPGLASMAHVSAIVGVVLSVASSAMATFDASVFIPAILAFSGAVTAWNNYQQIDLRLLQTNSAVNKLNQLLVWWDGLTMIEKRVPGHKETLVRSTEECIQAQATIFSGGGSRKSEDQDDDGEGDDKDKK